MSGWMEYGGIALAVMAGLALAMGVFVVLEWVWPTPLPDMRGEQATGLDVGGGCVHAEIMDCGMITGMAGLRPAAVAR